jgi:hypothetical protein
MIELYFDEPAKGYGLAHDPFNAACTPRTKFRNDAQMDHLAVCAALPKPQAKVRGQA